MKQKIINIAVIAHVDAGKSTLVDALLAQSGVFRENEEIIECVMDSNDIERERGITIYSKNCSVMHEGVKINIVDTPGHADFSSEVERIIRTVDTVILLVDSSEGPMPQTRFVLQKALEIGLRPILFINKIDKKDQRAEEVVDLTGDLFLELDADGEQLDFPVLYGVAKRGVAQYSPEGEGTDLTPLFETILSHADSYPDRDEDPLQFQVSALGYDDYIGRLGIGRLYAGTLRPGQTVSVCKADGSTVMRKVSQVFVYKGLARIPAERAESGDIVVVAGIGDISIGDTVCGEKQPLPMPTIRIEEPTLTMNFMVNTSPFAGKAGKYVTSRHLKERLERELEVNVGLLVEPLETTDGFKVSGRGELHLSVLLENMRREGYEVAVSKPEVILHREGDMLLEPMERVVVSVPEAYAGTAIAKLNLRKGMLLSMSNREGFARMEFLVPTRGLLGYRTEFINDTRGEGTLVRRFESFAEHKGAIPQRSNGAVVAIEEGVATAYAMAGIGERATLFLHPGTRVYEGMIVGLNSRAEDLPVNVCKAKKTTNMRAAGSDDAIRLAPPRIFSLEEALEFINDDELVEIVPGDIRLRKKRLKAADRRRGKEV